MNHCENRLRRCLVALIAASWLAAVEAQAFNPPIDTVGPLTARIEAPEEITKAQSPVAVRVVLENPSDRPIDGTVELQLIDHWQANPIGPVKFTVGKKATTTAEFKITPAAKSYNAHYPIHAFVRFATDGKSRVAHPIFVLRTKFPSTPAAVVPVEWRPISLPATGEMGLWMLPVRRSIVVVQNESPLTMPVGWQGAEPRTGGTTAVATQALGGEQRDIILMHPPWYEGRVGTIATEFPLQLPKTQPLRFQFANAVAPEGQGDGVTFRVRVAPFDSPAGTLGQIVFDRHTAAKTWQTAEVDLSQFAGQAIRLQLESHPGPKNDTGWDSSWSRIAWPAN